MLQNASVWVVWCYCLMKASHKERTVTIGYQEIDLEPGQFIATESSLSDELKISYQKTRSAIQFLIKTQRIHKKRTNKFSIITIVNWDNYQESERTINEQITNNQRTNNEEITNNQRTNNDQITNKPLSTIYYKNVNNNNILSQVEKFADLTQKNIKQRKNKLAPDVTKALIDKCVKTVDKLIRLDGFDFQYVCDVINWAIEDSFWSANMLSIAEVRRKKNGDLTKFQKIANAYESDRGKHGKSKNTGFNKEYYDSNSDFREEDSPWF